MEKYNLKGPQVRRPMNKKGHGSVIAGKAPQRKARGLKK
jgi:hypothetical protein